jgi:hypothetical protein
MTSYKAPETSSQDETTASSSCELCSITLEAVSPDSFALGCREGTWPNLKQKYIQHFGYKGEKISKLLNSRRILQSHFKLERAVPLR